jgi:hypothetical protein
MNTVAVAAEPLSPAPTSPDVPAVEVPAVALESPPDPPDPAPSTADRPDASHVELTAAAALPEPRPAVEPDGEQERGKAKKARKAVRAKSVGGTKALVVWREGRVQYADDNVLVVDLDEAAS